MACIDSHDADEPTRWFGLMSGEVMGRVSGEASRQRRGQKASPSELAGQVKPDNVGWRAVLTKIGLMPIDQLRWL